MSATSFASNRKFRDDENFPYGFDRSGEFTRNQADLLIQRGVAYQELASCLREPVTEEERNFVLFCQGGKAVESDDERVWSRYVDVIRRDRSYHSVGINPSYRRSSDDFSMDTD